LYFIKINELTKTDSIVIPFWYDKNE
jgi:hypothetical protein